MNTTKKYTTIRISTKARQTLEDIIKIYKAHSPQPDAEYQLGQVVERVLDAELQRLYDQ